MGLLYQDIMNVPGLGGSSSYQKQADYYSKLGSPMGAYNGSYAQNVWLSQQLSKPNYGLPQAAPTPAPAATKTPQQQAVEKAVNTTPKPSNAPLFSEVLPYQQAWESLKPFAEQEGNATINPFIQRDLNKQLQGYANNLAQTGGGRFGRGYSDAGTAMATAQANRKAQMLDWLSAREQGFKDLFYNPTQKTYNKAIELGQKNAAPKVPTWEEMATKEGRSVTSAPTAEIGFNPTFGAINDKQWIGETYKNQYRDLVNNYGDNTAWKDARAGFGGFDIPTGENQMYHVLPYTPSTGASTSWSQSIPSRSEGQIYKAF